MASLDGAASSLVVVGSIALDTISTPQASDRVGLGGSATYFSASAGLFSQPQVIAVLGEDFDRTQLDFLVERGVDLSTVTTQAGKTFHWQGSYDDDLAEATTLKTDLNVFANFEPELCDSQKDCDFLFLANILPQLQLKVVEQSRAKFVAADTMNLWINHERAALMKVLERIDMLIVNETEARLLSGQKCLTQAAHMIRSYGPKIVVIKCGRYGAAMLHDTSFFSCPAYLTANIVDPTGCGDTFAGGLLGTLAKHKTVTDDTLREGIIVGTALASHTIEGYSLDGLKRATLGSVQQRCRELEALTRFPAIRL